MKVTAEDERRQKAIRRKAKKASLAEEATLKAEILTQTAEDEGKPIGRPAASG